MRDERSPVPPPGRRPPPPGRCWPPIRHTPLRNTFAMAAPGTWADSLPTVRQTSHLARIFGRTPPLTACDRGQCSHQERMAKTAAREPPASPEPRPPISSPLGTRRVRAVPRRPTSRPR